MYSVPVGWLLVIVFLAAVSLSAVGAAAVDETAAATPSASAETEPTQLSASGIVDRCQVPSDRTVERAGFVDRVRGYWYIPD